MSIIFVVIIRSFIAFFSLLIFIRILGKQQVAELTFFDYVVGITIGSIASTLSVQVNQNTFATLVGMAIWILLPLLLAFICIHSATVRKLVEGEATVVIENGKILDNHLKKIRISIDDLLSELRVQGVFNISDVEFALFESNGKLSIQKKTQKQPVTPSDLNISTEYKGLPTNLICDGVLQESALRDLSLTKAWLHSQLSKNNINDFKQVALAQLDTTGKLYVDLKGDHQPYYIIDTKLN